MSRKNQRRDEYVPLDLTPIDLDRAPFTPEQVERHRELNAQRRQDRANRQAEASVNRGIDWSVCVIPGCGEALSVYEGTAHPDLEKRDAGLAIPICRRHSAVLWTQHVRYAQSSEFAEDVAQVKRDHAEREHGAREAKKVSHLANITHGDIYFVRIGPLIKVGWTRNLANRLKQYGASAELLATHPGSRADETTLHRQLRPALAKGREWYHDGDVVRVFVDEALAKHGPPQSFDWLWTEPKPVVAGKKAMRYR